MLKKIRVALACVFLAGITMLFLDFTGTVHQWLGWMARVQFLPALLAVHLTVVLGLVILTLLLGRVYCSVICPLGVMQDVISWLRGRKKKNRYRFRYSPAMNWLRYGVLVLFVAALVAGIGSFVALLAPYSSYGRIVQNLLQPVYIGINNVLAYFAERADSYMFYEKEVWIRSLGTFAVAAATFVVIAVLAWRNGRTYCNTICPVGTVLGFFSRFALLRPVIDIDKCNACGVCGKSCKASCIDSKNHKIDYSRCVACMDCVENCSHNAISYTVAYGRGKNAHVAPAESSGSGKESGDAGRRSFISCGVGLAAAGLASAQGKKVDGGLAVILDKKIPVRKTPIVPAGSRSLAHFRQHCTGCQLCVSVCPNGVLRPSSDAGSLMQPCASYERGYCRPECTKCADVCPAGAIRKITVADKSSVQVGHAVWVKANCVPLTDGVSCGNCARHCPTGAITMVPSDASDPESPKIPVVNEERCIGCGACENLCPARPFSAIYVEGHMNHRTV